MEEQSVVLPTEEGMMASYYDVSDKINDDGQCGNCRQQSVSLAVSGNGMWAPGHGLALTLSFR